MTRNEAVLNSLLKKPTAGQADLFCLDTYSAFKKRYQLPSAPIVNSKTKAKQNKCLTDRERQQDKRRR